jgi:HEAT repeat protein
MAPGVHRAGSLTWFFESPPGGPILTATATAFRAVRGILPRGHASSGAGATMARDFVRFVGSNPTEMTIRRKRWLLGALAFVLAAGGWFLFRPTAEPQYAGRWLRDWFREYCASGQWMTWDAGRHEEAACALRQIGTNGVPYLIEQAFKGRPTPAFQKRTYQLLNSLPKWWGLPPFVSPEVLGVEAGNALIMIRPPAKQLLPLVTPYLESTDHFRRCQVLFLLGATGDGAEAAVPWLCAALKGPDPMERALAVQSLGWIGPNADCAVPALIEVLKAPGDTNRLDHSAAYALGEIGSAGAPALPLVREVFERETNWNPRCSLAGDLCRIDANQTDALAFLTNGLVTHEPANERWIAASQLGRIGANARPAVPILLAALDGTNAMLFSQVPSVLKKMGVSSDTFLPRMKKQLASKDETTRVNAAARVLEVDPTDHEARVFLMGVIQKKGLFAGYAIEVLANAGPPVAEAVPVLRDVANNGSPPEREAALRALRRIDVKPARK